MKGNLNKSEIKIGTCRLKDLDEVHGIEQRNFPNPWPKFWFESLLPQNSVDFLVAEDKNVLGYAIAQIERRFNPWKLRFGERGRLLKIAVKKRARRRGIGTSLLQDINTRLTKRGASEIWLEVRTQNIGARKFYLAMGFEERKLVSSYYLDGEDAVIMAKNLPNNPENQSNP